MDHSDTHVEQYDASYGTDGDYAAGVASIIRSAHPDDPSIVPSYTLQERAALEFEREASARRAQELWARQYEAESASFSGPPPECAPDGTIIPTNAGAYSESIILDLPDERECIAPGEPQYLGASVESLMGSSAVRSSLGERVVYLTRHVTPLKPGQQFIGRAKAARASAGGVGHQAARVGAPRTEQERQNQYG